MKKRVAGPDGFEPPNLSVASVQSHESASEAEHSIQTELRAYGYKILLAVVSENLSLFNIFRDLCFERFSHKLLAFVL